MQDLRKTARADFAKLKQAQEAFGKILDDPVNSEVKLLFLSWICQEYGNSNHDKSLPNIASKPAKEALADVSPENETLYRSIIYDLRDALPISGALDSETAIVSTSTTDKHLEFVDHFLHDTQTVDDMCRKGDIKRYYCTDCGSLGIAQNKFLSFSTSKQQAMFYFQTLLPILSGKIVVNIGARIGAVLWTAYVHSKAWKIIGLEPNEDLCTILNGITTKHQLTNRIEIIKGEIYDFPDIIARSDVLVVSTEWQYSGATASASVGQELKQQQEHLWQFVKDNYKKTLLIVSNAPLPDDILTANSIEEVTPSPAAQFQLRHNADQLGPVKLYKLNKIDI